VNGFSFFHVVAMSNWFPPAACPLQLQGAGTRGENGQEELVQRWSSAQDGQSPSSPRQRMNADAALHEQSNSDLFVLCNSILVQFGANSCSVLATLFTLGTVAPVSGHPPSSCAPSPSPLGPCAWAACPLTVFSHEACRLLVLHPPLQATMPPHRRSRLDNAPSGKQPRCRTGTHLSRRDCCHLSIYLRFPLLSGCAHSFFFSVSDNCLSSPSCLSWPLFGFLFLSVKWSGGSCPSSRRH